MIKIEGLEVFAYHGVYPEEQRLGQKFLIDAALVTDTRKAGVTDELSESIDYGEACRFMSDFFQKNRFQLIEAAAEHLANAMLLKMDKLDRVILTIYKPWAPIGLPLKTVSVTIERGWHEAYLSVGSNMGERENLIRSGIEEIASLESVKEVAMSSLIETPPYGGIPQDPFLNAAVYLRTLLTPEELLAELHEAERRAGRERLIRWGPRTLDLDILFYDDVISERPELTIPHIDMQNRAFVLGPLMQLCPGKVHPVLRKTVAQMFREL